MSTTDVYCLLQVGERDNITGGHFEQQTAFNTVNQVYIYNTTQSDDITNKVLVPKLNVVMPQNYEIC